MTASKHEELGLMSRYEQVSVTQRKGGSCEFKVVLHDLKNLKYDDLINGRTYFDCGPFTARVHVGISIYPISLIA